MKKLFFTLFSAFIAMSAFAVTPDPLQIYPSNMMSCDPYGGAINVYITGGTAPYTCELSAMYGGPQYNETTSQSTVFFQDVMTGEYTLSVTDSSMQTVNLPITVYTLGFNAFIAGVIDPLCNNGTGSVELDILPAPYYYSSFDYSYSIDNGANWTSFSGMNITVPNLPKGNYQIKVRNNSTYCSTYCNAFVFTVPDAITFTADLTQPATANDKGSAALTITGGKAPYSYDINNKNNYVTLATNKVIADLPLGKDTIYLKDANGCMAQNTQSFIVSAVTSGADNAFAAGRSIKSSNKAIQIEQANGKQASLYDLNGTLLYRAVLNSDKVIIPVKESGLYLVSIDNQTQKVLVK